MKITVHYYGQLRHLAERDTEVVELSNGDDLVAALRRASQRYNAQFSKILFNGGEGFCGSVMVLINQKPIAREAMPALRDGDVVSLLPAISGG